MFWFVLQNVLSYYCGIYTRVMGLPLCDAIDRVCDYPQSI